jgi:hypothetical protein
MQVFYTCHHRTDDDQKEGLLINGKSVFNQLWKAMAQKA